MTIAALLMLESAFAIDHPKATVPSLSAERFTLVADGTPNPIVVSSEENTAILRAAENLVSDFVPRFPLYVCADFRYCPL